jgi:hypothetical protein
MTAFRTAANAMADCIDNCTACEQLCLEVLPLCQATGGERAGPQFLALLALCADVCGTNARAMRGGSSAYVFLSHACAEVCKRCADACAPFVDEPRMRACASACANCARSCAEMARAPYGQTSRTVPPPR